MKKQQTATLSGQLLYCSVPSPCNPLPCLPVSCSGLSKTKNVSHREEQGAQYPIPSWSLQSPSLVLMLLSNITVLDPPFPAHRELLWSNTELVKVGLKRETNFSTATDFNSTAHPLPSTALTDGTFNLPSPKWQQDVQHEIVKGAVLDWREPACDFCSLSPLFRKIWPKSVYDSNSAVYLLLN